MAGNKENRPEKLFFQKSRITDAFVKNLGGLRNYLSRFFYSVHDIEDVLQDTYICAVEAEKVNKIQMPKAFLYRVSKNLAINHHNKAAQRLVSYIEEFDETHVLESKGSLDTQVEQERRFVHFCHAAKLLPPQCRSAFVLKKVYGFSSKETADRLGITVSTVDKHLAKGMVICRNYLESKGYGFVDKTTVAKKRQSSK